MRGKGEGTIYKRGKGWIAQYYDPNGKRRTVSADTRKKVQEALNSALNSINEGTYREPSNIPFERFANDYLDNIKSREVQRSTYDGYKENLNRYVHGSKIENKIISQITTDDLQRYYNDLLESGVGNRTVHYHYSIINQTFRSAVKRKILKDNPNAYVTLPKKIRSNISVPEKEEIRRFLDYINDDPLKVLWRIFIFAGVRRSEALAIQKSDIDFDKGAITLRYSLGYVVNNGIVNTKAHRINILKENMKSDASQDVVYVDDETLDCIREYIEKQEDLIDINEDIWSYNIPFLRADNSISSIPNDLLFTREDGTVMSARVVLGKFQEILKRAGIERYTLHQLRHYFATQALEVTGDIALVSTMCRHSDISITSKFYAKTRNEHKQEAFSKVADNMV